MVAFNFPKSVTISWWDNISSGAIRKKILTHLNLLSIYPVRVGTGEGVVAINRSSSPSDEAAEHREACRWSLTSHLSGTELVLGVYCTHTPLELNAIASNSALFTKHNALFG